MAAIVLCWILMITATGFRISEEKLLFASKYKHYSRHSAVVHSLTLGTAVLAITIIVLATAIEMSFILLPAQSESWQVDARNAIGRWMPATDRNIIALVVTLSAFVDFLVAPAVFSVMSRNLRSGSVGG